MLLLDLGKQPLAERESDLYPLKLLTCGECSLVQLSYIVDNHEMFPPEHPYATGNTKFLRDYFSALGFELNQHALNGGETVVDIGANDCTFLQSLRADVKRIAVEPTDQIAKRNPAIIGYQQFWTAELGVQIAMEHGPAAIITASNVLAHVPDPHDFLEGVTGLLTPNGLFITENHDFSSISDGLQIDTIYHEHLRYYSVTSLSKLLSMHGLEVVSSVPIPTHGGSFRVTARKTRGHLAFRARQAASKLYDMVSDAASRGSIYGVGACTRATPLIHYSGIAGAINCVVEVPESDKIGMHMPGTAIKVVEERALIEDQPEYALLFCWHIAESVMPKLRKMGYKGKFIIPLPEPVILDG